MLWHFDPQNIKLSANAISRGIVDKKLLVDQQRLSLKNILGFAKKFSALVKSDEFFEQEKKVRSHLKTLKSMTNTN